jgi:hypothetical protein
MNKLHSLLLLFFIHSLGFATASAQGKDTALVPLASVDDFSKGKDGWSFALGLGVEYETAYEGSDEFGLEVEPAGGLQWRDGDNIYFFAGEAIGWRGVQQEIFAIISMTIGRFMAKAFSNILRLKCATALLRVGTMKPRLASALFTYSKPVCFKRFVLSALC